MTKAERMAILLWSEKISDEAQKRDSYFTQLQQLTREARMIVTCNPLVNRDHLQGTQFAIRADILYDQYIKAGAKLDAMMDLVGELSKVAADSLSGGNDWIVSRKGTHDKHLSVLDNKKEQRAKEAAALETVMENKSLRGIAANYERIKRAIGPQEVEQAVEAAKQRE